MCRKVMTKSLYFNTRAIDHFALFQFIKSSNLERHTVLFCAMLTHSSPLHWVTACSHLQTLKRRPWRLAFCAHFLLQAPKPCQILMQNQLSCLLPGISRRDSCNVTTPREVAGKVGFITVWELVFSLQLRRSLAHLVTCDSALSSWRLDLSQHAVLHCAQMCTLRASESSIQHTSTWMKRHMKWANATRISEPHYCHTTAACSHHARSALL